MCPPKDTELIDRRLPIVKGDPGGGGFATMIFLCVLTPKAHITIQQKKCWRSWEKFPLLYVIFPSLGPIFAFWGYTKQKFILLRSLQTYIILVCIDG